MEAGFDSWRIETGLDTAPPSMFTDWNVGVPSYSGFIYLYFCIFFLQKLNPIGQALAAAHVRQFSLCGVLIIVFYKTGFNKKMKEKTSFSEAASPIYTKILFNQK